MKKLLFLLLPIMLQAANTETKATEQTEQTKQNFFNPENLNIRLRTHPTTPLPPHPKQPLPKNQLYDYMRLQKSQNPMATQILAAWLEDYADPAQTYDSYQYILLASHPLKGYSKEELAEIASWLEECDKLKKTNRYDCSIL